ncbi:MAG: DUF4153 domain-containing protein [Halanaerobiaceae bacterium]
MNIIKIIKNGLHNLRKSLQRFPLAITCSTLSTLLFVYLAGSTQIPSGNYDIERIAMIFALGFPLYLCIRSIFEKRNNTQFKSRIITQIIAAVLLFLYYFFFLKEINMVSISRYIAVNLTLYLSFLYIPYFYKRDNFELYVVKIFSRLSITFLYSVVLYAGLSLSLFTIEKLLNVPISGDLYFQTWLLIIGIFAPIFLLAGVPHENEKIHLKDYPRLFEILLLYIVMPLIVFYTSILYIYFVKILITQQWPEGLVSHLVLWYAIVSISVLFSIKPLKKKSKWVSYFLTWLPRILLPLLTMLFIAITMRIKDYGVTENRYYVVLLGIWCSSILLYYIFSRKKRNIILPLSLAVISLLSVFGPWSSYSLSIHSQNNRFKNILEKYNMLENNTVVKRDTKISKNDREELNAILRYFDNNHKIKEIKYLPDNFVLDETDKLFGFSYSPYRYYNNDLDYFSHYISRKNKAFSVKDYDYVLYVSNNNSKIDPLDENTGIEISKSNIDINIERRGKKIYKISLNPILKKLHEKYKNKTNNEYDKKEFIYTDENDNVKVKYVFERLRGNTEIMNPDNITFSDLSYFMMIKIK